MSKPSDGRVGTVFAGRYEIVRLLGAGGMGAVYAARQTFTGRQVALKLLHSKSSGAGTGVKRFMREARAPNAIDHPGIAEVLDAGIHEETPYLAIELLEGHTLKAALDEGALDAHAVVLVAAATLDALAAAHAAGLVHRDVKPDNVFLTPDGDARTVKLLDFGITRELDSRDPTLTETGMVLGTAHYMSPEQARGEDVDARTDLWAVGAVLFFAFAGRVPFPGSSYNMILAGILSEPAPSLAGLRPDLPAELAALVGRALEKDRDARWGDASEMAEALRALAPSVEGAAAAAPIALAATESAPTPPTAKESPAASQSAPAAVPSMVTPPTGPRSAPRRWLPFALGLLGVAALALLVVRPWDEPTPEPSTTAVESPAPPVETPAPPIEPPPAPVAVEPPTVDPAPPEIDDARIEALIDERVEQRLEQDREAARSRARARREKAPPERTPLQREHEERLRRRILMQQCIVQCTNEEAACRHRGEHGCGPVSIACRMRCHDTGGEG